MAQLLSDKSEVAGNLQTLAANGYTDQIAENEQSSHYMGGLFGKDDPEALARGIEALGAKTGMLGTTIGRAQISDLGVSDFTEKPFETATALISKSASPIPLNVLLSPVKEYLNNKYDELESSYLWGVKDSRPDPHTTGYVAQVANSLIGTVPFYLYGIPAAAVIEGNTSFKEARSENLTENEALGKASIDAMWAAVFGKLPTSFAGGRIPSAIKGATATSIAGAANRESVSVYLDAIGHPEMADQYKAFDTQGLFTDLVFGAAFGFAHGKGMTLEPNAKAPPPSMVEDAAVANDAKFQEINASDGIPENTAARQAHNQAFERAREQLLNDEPVNVADIVQGKSFIDPPIDQNVSSIISKVLEESGFHESIAALRAAEEKAAAYGFEKTPDAYDSIANYTKSIKPKSEFSVEKSDEQITENIVMGGVGEETTSNAAPRHEYVARNKDGDVIGTAAFTPDEHGNYFAEHVQVSPEYRRQGVATSLYENAQKDGLNIVPSKQQSAEGKALTNTILKPEKYSIVPNENGSPVPATQAVKQVEKEIENSTKMASGIEIAADCAMRFGE